MSVLKCKMCGGDIEISEDKTIGICGSCGTTITFPKISDEQKLDAFNRGNYFRRLGEFDKALQVYEHIISEEPQNAEAHWCCALCRFGIEYVEDPATMEYIPTCHRASFDSFTEDIDYKAAVENADGITRKQYQKDAAKIAEVQRGILATSQNEEPFDVFICYKETDENGNRTVDSTYAQDIYYQLTDAGFRVFFSRITLENIAGNQYEPYIFAALNSAKVMVCIVSDLENINSVWVKNEWSRFIAIMRRDRSKVLLPCYKDINPYDLPEQLSVLQSYDMSKIGFMQDLIRGIKKITASDSPKTVVKETVVNNIQSSVNIAPLLKRAFMFLEDGNWEEADVYCERVLDQDPECAQAYLGKLMAELKVNSQDNLKYCNEPFDGSENCRKASKFSEELAGDLLEDNRLIRERKENNRKEKIYTTAKNSLNFAQKESEFISAADLFSSIKGYKDADELISVCYEKADVAHKNEIYASAVKLMYVKSELSDPVSRLKSAIEKFESIIDWKDSRTKIDECNKKIEDIRIDKEKADEERKRKEEESRLAAERTKQKIRKIAVIASPIVAVIIVFLIVLNTVIFPASNYKKALSAVEEGNYDTAYSLFNNNADYEDTEEQIKLAKVKEAEALLAEEKFNDAYAILNELGDTEKINESVYNRAKVLQKNKDYDGAIALFETIKDYNDVSDQIETCYVGKYGRERWNIIKSIRVGDAYTFGNYYCQSGSSKKEAIKWRVLDKQENKILIISEKALDCVRYNEENKSTTWETCTLRTWLNSTFYNEAFNKDEREMIVETNVTAEANSDYDTDAGNNTTDKIFLLSATEAENYFSSDNDRICKPTDYKAIVWEEDEAYDSSGGCFWWLRSTGDVSRSAAGVGFYGNIFNIGVYDGDAFVRPAMWIEI